MFGKSKQRNKEMSAGEIIVCPECHRAFMTEGGMKDHFKKEHPNKEITK